MEIYANKLNGTKIILYRLNYSKKIPEFSTMKIKCLIVLLTNCLWNESYKTFEFCFILWNSSCAWLYSQFTKMGVIGIYCYLLYCPTKCMLKNCTRRDGVISTEIFFKSLFLVKSFQMVQVQNRIHLSDSFLVSRPSRYEFSFRFCYVALSIKQLSWACLPLYKNGE